MSRPSPCVPLTPQEVGLSAGRQVLHFQPVRYDRWSQRVEVVSGEPLPGEPIPLLKHRREYSREEAIRLWGEKRKAGWAACGRQW